MAVNVQLNAKDFDCQHCQWGRHCDESNPHTHDAWVIKLYKAVIYEGRVCPKGTMEPFALQMLDDFTHYQNSILPFGGGRYDQPNIFMQAMSIIQQVYNEHGQT